ncbi:hypothetical protein [Mesorhizobium kowhaii]|uniref:Uncharacterized protein n=1 Tax=Mesorhizobium kowhaii TaxID=1300272 RepID=A0A2W7CBL9_9HYPH|nr:hypothetical protein [Mesorhizobium kowhaii]PZV40525.1 hypothetical protein B5V02_00400 [Mesorhizobium kowhaii]
MRAILGIFGVIQIGGAILIFLFAKSEIQEILGSVSFGMGVMTVGLSGVIALLEKQTVGLSGVIALLEKQLAISTDRGSLERGEVKDLPPSRHSLDYSYFEHAD